MTGQPLAVGAAAAAEARIALEHRDLQPGARQISGQRQAVVAGADDHPVETCHAVPRPDVRLRHTERYTAGGDDDNESKRAGHAAQKNAPARGAGAV